MAREREKAAFANITIACSNAEDCNPGGTPARIQITAASREELEADYETLKEMGWSISENVNYCPGCTKKIYGGRGPAA